MWVGKQSANFREFVCFLEFSTSELIPNRKGTSVISSEYAPTCLPERPWSRTTKQIPLMRCDLGLRDLSITSVPHCPSLPPLSKPFDSHISRDRLFLFGFVSFMLHIPPPSRHWLSILFGPSALLSNGFYFSCLSYLSFSLLESLLLAFKSLSYFPFGRFPGRQPSSSSKHTAVLTALLVSLVKFTLHGCLVPHACHWLPIFLERHSFSSCLIWDFCPLSTICFILFPSPHFPKDLIPMFMEMGLLYGFSTPWPLWSSLNHKVLISKTSHAH